MDALEQHTDSHAVTLDAHETSLDDLLGTVMHTISTYRRANSQHPVASGTSPATLSTRFGVHLQHQTLDPGAVIDELIAAATPGLVRTTGPRFFGFVVGGALPVATAADLLTVGWDQSALNATLSPAAIAAEETAGTWLKDLLNIPPSASVGFVTGAQQANTVSLAAARTHQLERVGWDVENDGLFGAPPVRVLVGEQRHASIDRALKLLGFGAATLEIVPVDALGAIRPVDLRRLLASQPAGPTIVCLQGVVTTSIEIPRCGSGNVRDECATSQAGEFAHFLTLTCFEH